jgi:hypothetical protein
MRKQKSSSKGRTPPRLPSLTAIAQDDDTRADEFCALPGNPAGLDGFDDGEEAKPVINRVGNPTVLPGNVAEMNISMPIRHGMLVARFSALAEEDERLARFEVLIRVAAEIHPGGRFASEFCYPTWVGPNTLFLEQGQCARSPTLWANLLGLAMPSNKKRMNRRQCDRRPVYEGTDEPVEVPRRHCAPLSADNQRGDKSDDERHPDSLELWQPLDDCWFVHVAALL